MRQNWRLAFVGIFFLLPAFLLLFTPIKCQQFSSTTNSPPPPSTTTSLLTLPPEVYRTTSTSPSGAAISSSSPLDAQIAHLKEDEVLDGRKDREKAKHDELSLAFEDGDEPTPMEAFSTTSPMPSSSTLNGGPIEGEEGGTMRPRQAPDETLPDPGQVADPSLVPVQLMRPDYRPLIAEGPSPIPPPPPPSTPAEEPTSSTVEQMGDEGGGETTTTAAGETEPEPTTTATTEAASTAEAEAAQAEAEAKEAEATAAAQEATAAQAEAEAKTQEAEAARNEAKAAQEEAEAARNEAAEAQTTPEPMAQTAENAGSRVAEAVPEGANDGDDQQRGAIDALTQALQRAQLLVQNITIVMPRDSPSMQAFLGALLASRPAMLAQNSAAQSRQLPPPTAMPMPLPVVASPLPPSTFIPVRPSPLAQPASFDPSSLSQMPMPQNYAFPPNGAAGTATGQQQKRPPRPSYLVEVEQLHSWIKSGRRLKLLDASYEPEAGIPDHIQFYKDYYGKWDKLIRDKKGRQYERSHIPEAIPFNLNIATYPSWNERQALYPPERFEEYVQRLGINRRDQLVIYARGPMAGMLHAARAWFLFRIYGHENVTVLNGGMDAWRRADLPANDQSVETQIGNWTARFRPELVVTFEELTNTDTDGYCILSRLYWYNFLDARPRNEYFGMVGAQMMGQQRNRLAGAKPFPADELVQDGLLVPPTEILRRLQQIGYARRQTIVLGNTADEASLALLALAQVGDSTARLYNGGMEEIRRRAAYLLTAKKRRRRR